MDKQKVTFKESNENLKKKSKKLISILMILSIGFAGGYYYSRNNSENNKISKQSSIELLKRADEIPNDVNPKDFVSETQLIEAANNLSKKLQDNHADISKDTTFCFVSLLNIDQINKTNPELAKKIKSKMSYDKYMQNNIFVSNEIYRVSTDYGINFDLSQYIFNKDDKEIMKSIQLITSFVDKNVNENNTEEINNVVIEDFIKPIYNLNDGFLNAQGKRFKAKPSTGLMYILYTHNSVIIDTKSNEELDNTPSQILNEMLKDNKVYDAVKDAYEPSYQKTK